MAKKPFCNIRNTIRSLRFHAGEMTQAELAAKIGVTRQTVLAIEAAKYPPSLELAFRIAEVFDVPLGEVFMRENVKT
jgi:putative transcriptional regulator